MSESYEPVEPTVHAVPGAAGPGRVTVVAAILFLLVTVGAMAVVLSSRTARDPVLAAGATASPSATADPSGKPQGERGKAWGGHGFNGSRMGRDVTITAISGNQVSLATDDGWRRTVAVTSTTTITKAGQAIAVAGLQVGDSVRFEQRKNDDGTYTVTAIAVLTPTVGGEVTAVSSTSITLKPRRGDAQVVKITGDTVFKVGKVAGSRSDVVVGSTVVVQGEVAGSTFTATTVHVRLEGVSGEVTAKTSSSITVKRRDGTSVTVHVDGDTAYRVRGTGDTAASLADIAVGDRIKASGTLRTDGSMDAQRVDGRKPKVKPTATPGA